MPQISIALFEEVSTFTGKKYLTILSKKLLYPLSKFPVNPPESINIIGFLYFSDYSFVIDR